MKDSQLPEPRSMVGRRNFIKLGAGAAAAISALDVLKASAQAPAALQGVPWWAARPGKSGVGKPTAIDMHTHWAPEAYNKALVELGHPVNSSYPLSIEMDQRRRWMDEHGDLMHCLTLNGGMPWQWTTPKQAAHLAQIINDAGIEVHQKYPDRFVLGAELPVNDYELALKELNRVAGQPGVRAVHLPDSVEKRDYVFDSNFAPVLARIEELKLPIVFHQMDGAVNAFGGDRTAGPPNLAAGIDAPIEHTFLATKLIYTGTLDKYPNLQIVLPHAGGAFPYLAGRQEHFLFHMNGPAISIQHPFRDYLRRFHYDYLIYWPEAFRFLMTMVGSDRIVVGTDNFAAKDVEYSTAVLDQFNLPPADRDLILSGNAKRLMRI
jgi:aminocarboxymuconate-semialdehyde decarboxylase